MISTLRCAVGSRAGRRESAPGLRLLLPVILLAVAEAAAADPRLSIVQLQLAGRHQEALAVASAAVGESPEHAGALHYLRGRLLEVSGERRAACEEYATAMGLAPTIAPYSRFRMALGQEALGHPEMAAGLVASLLAAGPPQHLITPATRLLVRSLAHGGECRLLRDLAAWPLPVAERRLLEVSRADCDLRNGEPERARARLHALLESEQQDAAARAAADRLDSALPPQELPQPLAVLIGMAFYDHREFDRASRYLELGLRGSEGADFDLRYRLARSYYWRADFPTAARLYHELAGSARRVDDVSLALYQQGRTLELQGRWAEAVQAFLHTYEADPFSDRAGAALLGALRLQWRANQEEPALALLSLLTSRRDWLAHRGRAALFLAVSDLVRQRADRAAGWLNQAALVQANGREVTYWRGRLAEVEGRPAVAVARYCELIAADPYHPLALDARERLALPTLAPAAQGEIQRQLAGGSAEQLVLVWRILGPKDAVAREALARAAERLRGNPSARRFLGLEPVAPADWPLWKQTLRQPEELLLALGLWDDGAPVVLRFFPLSDPALALTGSQILAQGGEAQRSLRVAEMLDGRVPRALPAPLLPQAFRRLLYPLPWSELILGEARRQAVDPFLLAGVIRQESRFNPTAVSGASARGLTQFVYPTAARLAAAVGLRNFEPEDLDRPQVSIALGAAYLAELAQGYGGSPEMMLAAYNAGEPQANLWRAYCLHPRDRAEYFTKVSISETRDYLRRVLDNRAQYAEIYGDE